MQRNQLHCTGYIMPRDEIRKHHTTGIKGYGIREPC
jgi:hypothetical protein